MRCMVFDLKCDFVDVIKWFNVQVSEVRPHWLMPKTDKVFSLIVLLQLYVQVFKKILVSKMQQKVINSLSVTTICFLLS